MIGNYYLKDLYVNGFGNEITTRDFVNCYIKRLRTLSDYIKACDSSYDSLTINTNEVHDVCEKLTNFKVHSLFRDVLTENISDSVSKGYITESDFVKIMCCWEALCNGFTLEEVINNE